MLSLPAIFSNHMVLQRNKNIAVWGESDGSRVVVTLGDNRVETAVKDGKWEMLLPPMEAGGPFILEISDGHSRILYRDVMIGEVWLAGGQSNMEFELRDCKDGERAVQQANDKLVRFYYTPKVAWVGDQLEEAERQACWETAKPENCWRWSAIGYFFARRIAAKLGVTVGIIGCNWGGTSASCWVPEETLEEDKKLHPYLEEYASSLSGLVEEEYLAEWERYEVEQPEFDKKAREYFATTENATWEEADRLFGPNPYPGPMGPRAPHRPCGLYESMLNRVMPYTLAGFLYYQGESDDRMPTLYDTLLSALIRRWRSDWRDDNLPFLMVQLPMFRDKNEPDYKNWPLIREAQMRVFNSVKNTGIAVALDKGEFDNIHPIDKEPVAKRLALQALYHVYGLETEKKVFGPVFQKYFILQDMMYIRFAHCEDGLVCTADEATGFELAGSDKVYYPAKAKIQGNQVLLQSAQVKRPLYGRYCWTNYGEVTLFGMNGIPVAPFRTSRQDGAEQILEMLKMPY